MAADLHDTASQRFVAIHLLARKWAEELPADSPWGSRLLRLAGLATDGKREMDQAVRGLRLTPSAGRRLKKALESLSRSMQQDSGISILVRCHEAPRQPAADVESALFRVAHGALMNAWRHARCSVVLIDLSFTDREAVLSISDDGVGLGRRWDEKASRFGMKNMRTTMEEVGGAFVVRRALPHGVAIEARAPLAR